MYGKAWVSDLTSMVILGVISHRVILPERTPGPSSRRTEIQLSDDRDLVLRVSGLPSFSTLTCTFFEEITWLTWRLSEQTYVRMLLNYKAKYLWEWLLFRLHRIISASLINDSSCVTVLSTVSSPSPRRAWTPVSSRDSAQCPANSRPGVLGEQSWTWPLVIWKILDRGYKTQ